MIKHVVMWKLKSEAEGASRSENIKQMIGKLNGLPGQVDGLDSLEVGENFNQSDAAFDLVLITTHKDREALAGYMEHPLHREVASFIGKVVSERRVVDFEC